MTIESWNARKFMKHFMLQAALGMEGVMFSAWSDARENHMFLNRSGMLEASIRIEKKKMPNGWTSYRLVSGVGGIDSNNGWKPYSQGGPGGIRTSTVSGLSYDPNRPYYAPFVELGTKNMAARPFILPAIVVRRNDFNRAMAAARTASILGGV